MSPNTPRKEFFHEQVRKHRRRGQVLPGVECWFYYVRQRTDAPHPTRRSMELRSHTAILLPRELAWKPFRTSRPSAGSSASCGFISLGISPDDISLNPPSDFYDGPLKHPENNHAWGILFCISSSFVFLCWKQEARGLPFRKYKR